LFHVEKIEILLMYKKVAIKVFQIRYLIMNSILTMSVSSNSKYFPENIMKNIRMYYSKIMVSIQKSNNGTKIFKKMIENNIEINLMSIITNYFNNFVNNENKYYMFNFVEKLKKLYTSEDSWEKKITNLFIMSNTFVNKTIQFTGINMLLSIKEHDNNSKYLEITSQDIYDLCNSFKEVVYCNQISKNTFCLMFLNNDDAKTISDIINNKYIEYIEDDCKYTINTRFILPSIKTKIKKFDWNTKSNYECINIPYYKAIQIPIKEIIQTSEMLRNL